MNWLAVKNNQSFAVETIPFFDKEDFYIIVRDLLSGGSRMIGLMPINSKKPELLLAVLAGSDPNQALIYLVGGIFDKEKLELESWANEFPQTNYFECELSENFNYLPLNHPEFGLRPVRKQSVILKDKPYNFFRLKGDEVHEVAVGPIHAGVIEPGHFRFQCHGEVVYNLEINLGYQHRGVEHLLVKGKENQRIVLAESIAGDTTIGHSFAHCNAIEGLMKLHLSLRSEVIRSLALEMERIAMHLTGLAGLANDIGFALPSVSYKRLRTYVVNSIAEICGSRFGRGLMVYGGVRFDLPNEKISKIISSLSIIQKDVKQINEYLFSSTGAFSRFEETGVVTQKLAKSIGLVGLAARASGLEQDIRSFFPYSAYLYSPISLMTLKSGDVFARAEMRAIEIQESLRFIFEQLENLPKGNIRVPQGRSAGNSGVISLVEGWRGEIVHIVFTDAEGEVVTYKVKDPSFNNWYGLSLALRETAISDFPLCNKSFDLSYSGHDL